MTVSRQSDVEDTIEALLEIALENGQQDRVDKLLGFQAQLARTLLRVGDAYPGQVIRSEDVVIIKPNLDELDDTNVPARPARPHVEGEATCPICFDTFPLDDMDSLCGSQEHSYCYPCLRRYLSQQINDNEVETIACPWPGCDSEATVQTIKMLCPSDVYEKYLKFSLLAFLKTEVNIVWCPNPSCASPMELTLEKDDCGTVWCQSCQTDFCSACNKLAHPDVTCDQAASLAEDVLFQKWLAQKSVLVKICPHCKCHVEKNEGCNHIRYVQSFLSCL